MMVLKMRHVYRMGVKQSFVTQVTLRHVILDDSEAYLI
jgi:hypothetical protein